MATAPEKISKIEGVRRRFADLKLALCCPVCQEELSLSRNSFCCPKGHCFDLAAQNYLNLAPGHSQNNKYAAGLFRARRQVFQAGFYNRLQMVLLDLAWEYWQDERPKPLLLLDAGCGEGFFAAGLAEQLKETGINEAQICALDLSRDGIRLAAQYRSPGLYCLVGDLARLPLADHSLDMVINILSPANYGEFTRVLRPGGMLIKVLPGPDYLQEVRSALGIAPPEPAELRQTAQLWRQHFQGGHTRRLLLRYQRSLMPEQAAAFLQMSPLSFNHAPQTKGEHVSLSQITIDLQILVTTVQ